MISKILHPFIFLALLLVGCNSEPVVIYGALKILANGHEYRDFVSGKEITLTAEVTDLENYTVSWKVDGVDFSTGGTTIVVGPFEKKSIHTVTAKVVSGTNELSDSAVLKIGTPVEWNGKLSLSGTSIINEVGKPIQLRGMSTHGIQYFNKFYTDSSFKALALDWHADIIRISCYVNEGWGEHGEYLDDPTYWKNRIDTLVGYAEKYGMYAMIDWHQLVPGDPNEFITVAKEFFT